MTFNSVRCSLGILFRPLYTSSALSKGKTQRLRVCSGLGNTGTSSTKAISRRDSVTQMRATASRTKWESAKATELRLLGLHPPPTLNVFFAEQFEPKRWPLNDAASMLREASSPEMFNCLDNPLYAKVILNQRTKKASKFIAKLEGSCTLPYQLDFLPKRRIIVLTSNAAAAEQCTSQWGALEAGGMEIVRRLELGTYHWEEYDDIVAHPEFTDALHKVRKIIRNRMPTSKNGRMGEDVIGLLKAQQICVHLNSTPVEGVPEVNELKVILGQLCWDNSHLEDNLRCYLRAIDEAKSTRVDGDAIERVDLFCPPCDEVFRLDVAQLFSEKQYQADNNNKEGVSA